MAVQFQHDGDTGSNKPEPYVVKLISQAYSYKRPSGFVVSVLKPVIDRLAVTIPVTDTSDQSALAEGLSKHKKSVLKKSHSTPEGWGSGKYKYSYAVDCQGGGDALVQHTNGKTNVSFCRIELNPALIGQAGVWGFRNMLSELTGGVLSDKALMAQAKITRLDIAVDLINVDIEDVLVSSSTTGKTHSYFSAAGKIESTYLNVTTKGSCLYIYDKKTEQQEKPQKLPKFGNTKHTRVEVRTNSSKPLSALSTLSDRLSGKIALMDIEAPSAPVGTFQWEMFKDSCRYRGTDAALSKLPNDVRSVYENALNTNSSTLWKPSHIWQHWPWAVMQAGLGPVPGSDG